MVRKNDIKMYSTYNEGKPERSIRNLKNKIDKYITSVSKDMYIDKLNDIVSKYNNTYHRSIKVKPVDAKPKAYNDFSKGINDEHPKFKIGNIVGISKKKLQKAMFQIRRKKFWYWKLVISDLKGEEIVGRFLLNRVAKNKSKNV